MKSIVICGSLKNIELMQEFINRLTEEGVKVYAPINEKFSGIWAELPENFKGYSAMGLAYNHFQKIRKADIVFILNKDGYAGYSTSMELGFAVASGKPVFAYEKDQEISRDVLYDGYASTSEDLLKLLK